jgi:autotransporter-associated beta strand protein
MMGWSSFDGGFCGGFFWGERIMTFKNSWVRTVSNRCSILARAGALLVSATSALAVTTTYTTQIASMNQLRTEKNNSPPYAGTYDSGSDLGQYANNGWFGNTPGAAAFRTFTIDGTDETTAARVLYPGDRFTVTAYVGSNPSAGGYLGVSFRDSTDYADFFKSTVDAEAEFQLDNTGGWKLYRSGGSDDSGLGAGADRTFTITITSANSFNATIGNVTYYDVDMAASGGTIDSLAFYSFGDANANSIWKNASLENLGTIELGAGNATKTISGLIANGRAANSTSAVSTNQVVKSGTGTITLTANNSYSGGTIISNGTLLVGSGGRPGTSNIVVQTNAFLSFGRSDTYGGGDTDYNLNFIVNGGTITNSGNYFNTLGPLTLNGGTLGSGGGALGGFPSFQLRKTVTVLANANPSRITSGTAANSEITISTNTIFNVADGAAAQDLIVSAVLQNGSGGAGILTKVGAGVMVLSAANTYSRSNLVFEGTLLYNGTNTSASTVVASNAVLGGVGKIAVLAVGDGGILSPGDAGRGTFTAANTTWAPNGSYVWEISDFSGTAGASTGWDLFRSTGTLTLSATVGNEFTVRVVSVTSGGVAGNAANFSGLATTQLIANAATISGFATNLFRLDLSGLSNPYDGTWVIQQFGSTNIGLVYSPPPPDIQLLGINGASIASGELTTGSAIGTDFGSLDLTSSGISRTFTITNAASGLLHLNGSPAVSISGANAADFVVTTQPSTTLSGNTKTTFTVRFLPLGTGTRQATVSIASDDPDENPFTFALQGTGTFASSAFPYRVQVQFCGYGRENLTNFPALVVLGSAITNFNYNGFLSASGADLRFTDGGQTRLLNYEIETWSTNTNSYVWVQLPGLASSTTTVWAMWGNASAATAPAYTTNGATWSEGYVGVWHLGETSGEYRDSTGTNPGTLVDANSSSARGTNSLIGRGIKFIGGGGEPDFIQIANESNFKLYSNLTLLAWVKGVSGDDWSPWVSKRGEGQGYALRHRAGGAPDWCTRGTTTDEQFGPSINSTDWHFIAGSLSSGSTKTKRLFIDGAVAAEASVTGAIVDTPDQLLIGARTNGASYSGGIIDEVRVSRIERSTNWVWAEFQNSGSNGAFNCYGSVSGGPEIGVLGTNLASITDGSGSTSVALGTDFGAITLAMGARSDRIFTITNSGNATLTLSGSPIISLSGAAANDFSLIAGPTRTNLTPGQTATFTVRFQPSATGTRAAQISLASDDGDENPYNFAIAGTGNFSPSAYTYRLPLQFCGYTRSETLTNFPVLVVLNTGVAGFNYSQFKGANGGDLRFSDGAQTSLLNFEIESWDPGGNSYVWVQVPALSNANASIYAYWGNTNATTLPVYATNGATWSERFAGVWHLAETSGNSLDSSTNGLTGYPSNGITQTATGQIGGGDDFPGGGSRTYFGTPAVLNNLINNFTASAWIRPDALGGNRVIFGAHWGSLNGWSFRMDGANPAIERLPGGTLSSGVALSAGQWSAVTVVYDSANNATFYINGVKVATVTGTTPAGVATQPWYLGANNGDYFDGILDEVQVSQVVRSSNWVWAAYQNTASNATFTCPGALQGPGELLVLGTNGDVIASGSTSVSEANGTDYGLVPVSSYREHTFRLTNAGVGTLTITGVTTTGVHKANFSVRSFPTSISGLSASNLVIRFTPPGSGSRTATVTVASSDDTAPSYSFTLVGSDSSAGIAVGPTNLAYSGTLGTNFSQTLGVTNIGSISLPYSFTSDVAWITSPDAGITFTNAPLAGQLHALSISFTNPLCEAGIFTGRVVVTAPLATNSPLVIPVVVTVAGPAAPTAVSATSSGQEMVRLAWTPAGSDPVMIVHRAGAALSANPSGCSSYSVGSSLGGGTVIYLGAASALEHVVQAANTNYYRFYTVRSNVYYSAATAVSATTIAYGESLVLAESFAYTNSLGLGTLNGGLGWTSAWGNGSSYLVTTSSLSSASGYAGGLGNAATNAAGSQILRGIPPLTPAGGRRYLSFQMRYSGAGYAGLSFFDGGSEQLFVGQRSAAHEFGIVYYGGTSPSRGVNSMKVGTDYTIVAMMDVANGTISASMYTNASETVPAVEPTTWQVTATGPITSVYNRIRLGSGVGAGFDEIRIGHTWRDVVDTTPYTFTVQPTSLLFHADAGASSTSQIFQVVNGQATSYGYTNVVSYGSGASGWLNFSTTSATLSAYSAVTHTSWVSSILSAGGTFVATNRIVSSSSTLTQVVTVVVSSIPAPTAAAVATDGPELRRLTWTESNNRDVMIVHRSGAAPAADPVQGNSYTVGSTIPGSGATVIYIGTNGYLEHVGTAGAAPYYKFYAVGAGSIYSTGALVSVAAQSYPVGVIVDQAAATSSVALVSLGSGQGWAGAWSTTYSASDFTIVTNAAAGTPSFASIAGFPTSYAQRIKMPNQGSGGVGTAARTFTALSSGKVYMSYVMSYQYPGAQKFIGLSLMSSGTEKAFFGETASANGTLGIDSYGGSGAYNSGLALPSYQEGIGNVFLVIGAYDFATRELKVTAYPANSSVPASEPSVWTLSTNLPAGRITSLNGVRLTAGCSDGLNSIGDTYFDEVRVARTWAGLVQQTAPVLSSYSLNNGQPVTDAQLTNGAWSVTMNFFDPAGMATSPLDYDLWNTNSTELATDLTFSTLDFSAGGTRLSASNSTQTALSGNQVYVGPYYLRWSAFNSNSVGAVNSTSDTNNNSVTVNVVDDDATAPVASSFTSVNGTLYYLGDLAGGLLVTGLIQDVGSGVYGGSSNRYQLLRNGTQVDAGAFSVSPASDGDARATAESLEVTLSGGLVDVIGTYTFIVLSRDSDNDRPNDSLVGSNTFTFSVNAYTAPDAPAVYAATLTTPTSFQANWGASAGATGYRLDVSLVNTFSSFVSGFNNRDVANVNLYSVSGLTAGNTYYYRVRAYNSLTSTNSAVITNTLPATATVAIVDIPASGASTSMNWTATEGASYDIYYSDSDPSGSMTWQLVASGVNASANPMTYPVAEDDKRYYRVVIAGANPTTALSPIWGVIKPTIPSGFSMQSVPLDITDRSMGGELGDALKAVLSNGDKVYAMEVNGSFTTITLSGGTWDTAYTFAEGQGFFVQSASGATPRFAGPVGNDGSATRTINPGASPTSGRWNILGLSQGKTLSFSSAFATGNFTGTPTADWDETVSDLVVIDQGNGNWKRVMRTGSSTWLDLDTFSTPSVNLAPGSAVYYFHYGNSALSINF